MILSYILLGLSFIIMVLSFCIRKRPSVRGTGMSYFVVIRRYDCPKGLLPVTGNDGEDDEELCAFDTEEEAQKWLDDSPLIQCGQFVGEVYEAP